MFHFSKRDVLQVAIGVVFVFGFLALAHAAFAQTQIQTYPDRPYWANQIREHVKANYPPKPWPPRRGDRVLAGRVAGYVLPRSRNRSLAGVRSTCVQTPRVVRRNGRVVRDRQGRIVRRWDMHRCRVVNGIVVYRVTAVVFRNGAVGTRGLR